METVSTFLALFLSFFSIFSIVLGSVRSDFVMRIISGFLSNSLSAFAENRDCKIVDECGEDAPSPSSGKLHYNFPILYGLFYSQLQDQRSLKKYNAKVPQPFLCA